MKRARQVECTINGLGERAGTLLEEIVMAVRTRQDIFPCDTDLDTTQIMNCSKMVSGITGFNVQPNKAIVGANAFAHEAGIHQDGVLKSRETYEIMRAQDVGWSTNKLVLGKHSGRAVKTACRTEHHLTPRKNSTRSSPFQGAGRQKHEIFDEDCSRWSTKPPSKPRMKRSNWSVSGLLRNREPVASMTLNIEGEEQPVQR